MGRIADKLRQEFQKAARSKIVPFSALARGKETAESCPDMGEMVRDGTHPVHAVYKHTINLLSVFVEEVVNLPFLHRVYKSLAKAEDLYTPAYPPMSPITLTYYNSWIMFDLRFGLDKETMGECFLAVADLLGLDPVQVEATRNLCQSSQGIYQTVGAGGGAFRLRELVTNREIRAMIPTGFKTSPGRLILIRVLPTLAGMDSPRIGLTTPYVLAGTTEAEWLEYFQRHQIIPGTVGVEERLRQHMKQGKDDWYWSEYIFNGYVNYRSDAIFLTGFPDRPETQPHHHDFDEGTLTKRLADEMDEAMAR